ncbi:uncharacterized protein HD556DRAFT_1311781 [Suillus plorans]|uniref:Ion transport domain-containing protein n=1 Tax=Suillus plorans TaxID=116603 RepID=A0A9P7AGB5_9AGAM|nr:uncharacterized protein HD556DRAFT_1311781 [Suillus plorans]KAG1788865.1 hypothetical protein HD556DRAFT_1311781 [Suillus plorans]
MTIFLLVVNLLAVLVCVELIRGDMNDSIGLNFGQLWNSFLAMYQLFSSENWTNILYSTAITGISLGQVVIVIIFLCSWLIFANFIMMQMFVAVIHENFSVAEETKKSKQASDYWVQHHPQRVTHNSWTRKLNPYQRIKADLFASRIMGLLDSTTETGLDILAKVGNGNDTTENDHDEHSEWKAQKAGPSRNVSNIAARDYEDLSQCRIPVYACTNKIKIVRGIVKQQHHISEPRKGDSLIFLRHFMIGKRRDFHNYEATSEGRYLPGDDHVLARVGNTIYYVSVGNSCEKALPLHTNRDVLTEQVTNNLCPTPALQNRDHQGPRVRVTQGYYKGTRVSQGYRGIVTILARRDIPSPGVLPIVQGYRGLQIQTHTPTLKYPYPRPPGVAHTPADPYSKTTPKDPHIRT